jgi:hypothetical protein
LNDHKNVQKDSQISNTGRLLTCLAIFESVPVHVAIHPDHHRLDRSVACESGCQSTRTCLAALPKRACDALHLALGANDPETKAVLLKAGGDANGRHFGPWSRCFPFEINAESDTGTKKAAVWGSALKAAKLIGSCRREEPVGRVGSDRRKSAAAWLRVVGHMDVSFGTAAF